ncbi:MAG: tRNA (guanosine(18)-2'-O)-methyltransferase TrmH [Proteobacteria bacterium]|nr:tRNA (guanosine(18)-2'-O)-methyltransferase TrmH [Pseudomonadota bacterium]
MTPKRFKTLQKILRQRQPDLTLVMDGVHKPHNFNAIIRSCDSVGVFQVHYVPVEAGFRPLKHTASGSQKYVVANEHQNFTSLCLELKDSGHQILAAHLSDQAVDFRSIDFTKPTALVMGAELEGISDKTAELVDQHITIPMYGMVESLNVSVAAAIILFEAQRQRTVHGMYDRCSLNETVYEKVLFEWCWPKIAKLCQQKNRPYPQLDESGDFDKF